MVKLHSSYSSIDSLRLCISDIKEYYQKHSLAIPETLDFYGTIKLHGTNAGVGYNNQNGMWYQSRSNIITPEKDNAGFAKFAESKKEIFMNMINIVKTTYNIDLDNYSIVLFGEWTGKGIQKGVAISEMERFFALFDVKVFNSSNKDDCYYIKGSSSPLTPQKFPELKSDSANNIYNIHEYRTYNIKLNFSDLESLQKELTSYIDEIEVQCPFASAFNVRGPGEGIVFTHYFEDKNNNQQRFIFKVKGDEHKASKEAKKIEIRPEQMSEIDLFIERTVTNNRFQQALDYVYKFNPELETYNKKPEQKHMKHIVQWVLNDILKEERDNIVLNNYEPKQINIAVSKKVFALFTEELTRLRCPAPPS